MAKRSRYKQILRAIGIVVLTCLLAPVYLMAQDQPSAVQFHGTNILFGQYASRLDTNSEMPKGLLRNDLDMTLSIKDIPIESSFYLTTEQGDKMQRINHLSLRVDLVTLKKNKSRIEAYNKANKINDGKAPWMLRFLSNFSRIEAGRFRPDYGELSLRGISVSGVNLELTNKIVYAAFATGQVKRATSRDTNFYDTYKQKLLFGKFGFGAKRTTHLYVTYINISDETSVPLYRPEDSVTTLKPQSNAIVGTEFRLSFFKNKWTIDGEAGLCAITRDTRVSQSYDRYYLDSIFNYVPYWLLDQVNANVSTSADYAYSVSTKLNLKTTTISGAYKWVGPGFYTLGNPMLINDRRTIEGRVDQAFFKRMVSVSAYIKRFNDNLIDWKTGTTRSTAFGIIAKLTFKKAPYFQLSYTPNYQETTGPHLSIKNNIKIFSFATGYKYNISDIMSFTSLNFYNQITDYEYAAVNTKNKTQTYTINEVLNFNMPLQANFNLSYSSMKYENSKRHVISCVISGTYTYKQRWENTLGMRLLNAKTIYEISSEGEDLTEKKFSLFWDTEINIWKEWYFSLRIDENIFKSGGDNEDFNEFIAQGKLTLKW